MVKKFGTYFNFPYGSWREFLSALCPFLLFGIFSPLIDLLAKLDLVVPRSLFVNTIGIVLIAMLGILFLVGLFSGLPRWFLPYIGFVLSLLSVYGFSMLLEKWRVIPFQTLYAHSWYLGQIAFQGYLWSGLTLIALLLTVLIARVPVLRRFQSDWTLLAFLLYGAVPFAISFTFDDHVNGELARFIAFLILVANLWFYLRTDDPRLRFWVLFGGMTVSLLFAGISKAILYQYSWDGIPYFPWWRAMMSTVIMWGWIALSMLAAALPSVFRSADPA